MDIQEMIVRKVTDLAKKAGNNICAECPERHPTWVSIIKPPMKGGEPLAVFICKGCYKHHHRMGPKVCDVKGISLATRWDEAELEIVLKTGNEMVNHIYEGQEGDFNDDKEIITFDKNEEVKRRGQYIYNKYVELKYFSEYHYHLQMTKLNPDYRQQGRNAIEVENPAAEPGTPPNKRIAKDFYSTKDYNTSSPSDASKQMVNLPHMQPNSRASSDSLVSVLATPGKKNMSDSSARGRRTIPQSGLITPRNRGRGRVSGAADLYGRQKQQAIMALSVDLDGSNRGHGEEEDEDDDNLSVSSSASSRGRRRRPDGLSGSMHGGSTQGGRDRARSVSVRRGRAGGLSQSVRGGDERMRSASLARRGSMQNSVPSEESLGYGVDHRSENQRTRGSSVRRESMQHRRATDHSLGYNEDQMSGSQRSRSTSVRRRRTLTHGMEREGSERSLGGSHRGGPGRRRQSLSNSSRRNNEDRPQGKSSLLHPDESESESEAERDMLPGRRRPPPLEKGAHQQGMALPPSLQSSGQRRPRGSAKGHGPKVDNNDNLDRRRRCMIKGQQSLSGRSLDKAKSLGDDSMGDESGGSKGSGKSETRSVGNSMRKMRTCVSMDDSSAKALRRSKKEGSSRGKRSVSMKDTSEGNRSSRGKRSVSMKDASEGDRSGRSKRTTGGPTEETMDFNWEEHKAKLDKKFAKKSSGSKAKRRQTLGHTTAESDSDSDDSEERRAKPVQKKTSRRSMPAKKMTRSSSTGNLKAKGNADSDSDGEGKKRTRRVRKSSTFHAGKHPTKGSKYKNLDSDVKGSNYAAGSVGILMDLVQTSVQIKEKGLKIKEKSSSFVEPKNASVEGIKNAAPRESMVSQWLSPEVVAEVSAGMDPKMKVKRVPKDYPADDLKGVAAEPVWLSI